MKASSKGNVLLLVVNSGTLACIEYSSMMLIPAKKKIREKECSQQTKHLLLIQKTIYWKFLCSMFQ